VADLKPAPAETPDTTLSRGRLGALAIVFFVVAAAAPLVGMTGGVPVAIVLGNGAAVPGTYLVVGIALLIFSVGYAAMSSKVTNTGAFFAYVGRGLGVVSGVGSAFVSLIAYITIQLAIFGFFGAVMAGQMFYQFGIELPWYAWSFLAWIVVLLLSILRVDVGAKVLGVLLGLEILSLLVMAVAVLIQGGGPDGLDVGAAFSPAAIMAGGLAGSAGIAFAFTFASFIGFEATAIYGEESKDPKKTVPRATYLAVIVITLLFVFASWAVVSGLGSSTVVDQVVQISSIEGVPLADPAAVLFYVADTYVGAWLAQVMGWLVLSSLFAGLLAFQNSIARYFFAMGRAGVFPSALDRVNKRGAPMLASVVTSIISAIVMVIFAALALDPVLNLFYWTSAVSVLAIVLVEILVSVAVIAYFRKNSTGAKMWNTLLAPLIAIMVLAIGAYLLIAKFALFAGTAAEGSDPTTQNFALNPLGWFLVALPFIAFIIGLIVGQIRRRSENADAIADLVS